MKTDYLIVGGGPGGYEVAAELSAHSRSVTLIEKQQLGGTCLNRGCIPTKALAAVADRLLTIASAGKFGIEVGAVKADYAMAHRYAVEVVDTLRADIDSLLKDVNVVRGEARFTSDHTVEVDGQTFSADTIIIATGSQPAKLRCPGGERALTSDEFLGLDKLPDGAVAIVGGGVIGLEFASILNAFGIEVSVVEFCKEILPGFDPDLAKRLRQTLSKRGVTFYCSTAVEKVETSHLLCSGRKGTVQIPADGAVIAAIGRRAVVPPGLENTQIRLNDRGFIDVDAATYRTAADGVYAVGDVNGRCMLAHAASAQARVVAGLPAEPALIPSVVFTVPQLASVGTQEGRVLRIPYACNGKALADGYPDGVLKLVCDDLGHIIGCHVLGGHAADIVAEATLAISAGLTTGQLSAVTHAHPSLSELLQTACRRI